jgi:peptidoglycan hydrolase CwlO-like protein
MRRLAVLISTLAASLLLAVLPALSAEETMGQTEQSQQKDECLLLAKNCTNEVDSLQQRIDKLYNEIAKGTAVYTPGEIQVLEDKLNDALRDLQDMQYGP